MNLVKSRFDLSPRGGAAFKDVTTLRFAGAPVDALIAQKLDQTAGYLIGGAGCANFENWPADGQLGLLSMSWGMGPAFNLPEVAGIARDRTWTEAPTECRLQPDTGCISTRNDR
jgi:hypothetical protein